MLLLSLLELRLQGLSTIAHSIQCNLNFFPIPLFSLKLVLKACQLLGMRLFCN